MPVAVTVSTTDSDVTANVKTFVDNYNKFRKRLDELTAYDSEQAKASVLTGDATAARLEQDMANLVSGRFLTTAGSIQSLRQIGVTLNDDGTLEYDEVGARKPSTPPIRKA